MFVARHCNIIINDRIIRVIRFLASIKRLAKQMFLKGEINCISLHVPNYQYRWFACQWHLIFFRRTGNCRIFIVTSTHEYMLKTQLQCLTKSQDNKRQIVFATHTQVKCHKENSNEKHKNLQTHSFFSNDSFNEKIAK